MKLTWTAPKQLIASQVDRINSVPGVYRISVKLINGNLKVIYVGQTNDIHHRMKQYLNFDTDNLCLLNHLKQHNCYFRAARVNTQTDRDACEKALFEFFNPECNNPNGIPNVQAAQININ